MSPPALAANAPPQAVAARPHTLSVIPPPRPSCDSRRMAPVFPSCARLRLSSTSSYSPTTALSSSASGEFQGAGGTARYGSFRIVLPRARSWRDGWVLECRPNSGRSPRPPRALVAALYRRPLAPCRLPDTYGRRRPPTECLSLRPRPASGRPGLIPGPDERMIPHHVGASLTATLRGLPIPGPDPPCDHEATQLHRPHQADQLPERASSGQPQAHRSAPEARLGPGTRTWPGKPLACCHRRMDDCVRCRSRSSQPARTRPIRARSETGSGDELRLIPATLDL